jgi:HK97 family phage portal protein
MRNPFKKKSLLPGAPDRSGFVTTLTPPGFVQLYEGNASSYAQIYNESAAVRSVVRLISEGAARVPLHFFQRSGDSGRQQLPRKNELVQLWAQPNHRTSSYRFLRDVVADLLVFGNSYGVKVRDDEGKVRALVRLLAPSVSLVAEDESEAAIYRAHFGATTKDYQADDIVHWRTYNPSDQRIGVSPLESLRVVLAEDRAASEHRAAFYQNAGRVEGVIERPLESGEWSDVARLRFREDWERLHTGTESAGRIAVLEESMRLSPISFSPRDADFVAGRRQILEVVCAVYGLPSQLLGLSDRNLSEAHRHLYMDVVSPWLAMVEEEVNLDIIPDIAGLEQTRHQRQFAEFQLAELLRGSFREESEVFERAVGGPWMTANEARAAKNLEPLDGGNSLIQPAGTSSGDLVVNAHLPKGEPPVVNVAPANPEVNVVTARKQRKTRKTIERDKQTGAAVAVVEEEE